MDLQAKLEVFKCGFLKTLSVSKIAVRRQSTNEWVSRFGGMTLTWETHVLGEKPVLFSLSPPEASNGRRKIEAGFPQWEAGDSYSVVAHLMVLRCIYLEKFRKATKTPAAESSAQPIGPGYESDASYISLPSSVVHERTGTFRLQLSVFLPHHWLGFIKWIDEVSLSERPVVLWRFEATFTRTWIYARHWTVEFLGLCQKLRYCPMVFPVCLKCLRDAEYSPVLTGLFAFHTDDPNSVVYVWS